MTTVILHPRPLIFLDTAAILDILRVPFRHDLQVDIVESAAVIVAHALVDPRSIWVVATANVMHEFQANRQQVEEELAGHIAKLRQSTARVSGVAKILFPEHRIGSVGWQEHNLQERLLGIVDRLVNALFLFQGTVECVGKARNRLWGAVPPASKAKQEYKDCEIFEEFLELITALRVGGSIARLSS